MPFVKRQYAYSMHLLHPLKHLLYLLHRKPNARRPAVGAGVGHAAGEEVAEQLFHLPHIKLAMDFNGRVAGHDAQDLLAEPVHLSAQAVHLDFIEDVEEQLSVVGASQKGRHGLDHKGVAAEFFHKESETVQLGKIFGKQSLFRMIDLNLHGKEEVLDGDVPGAELVLELFKEHPLVGRVLVNERHTVLRLGHDKGIVDLGEGEEQCGIWK